MRTTDKEHVEKVRNSWIYLHEKGDIYKGLHSGWYSVSEESFIPESQITDQKVEWISEENYKFKLTKYKPQLKEFLESNPITPSNQVPSILQMLDKIEDLSVSRLASKMKWGIPVPNDPKHLIYVWLDALMNYRYGTNVHVIGKDILKFHAIYYPAFLLALGKDLPAKIFSHSHWTVDSVKMSKSIGNVVDPNTVIGQYGSDALRFYLLKESFIDSDSSIYFLM